MSLLDFKGWVALVWGKIGIFGGVQLISCQI